MTGIGGVGKTRLAVHYAHQQKQHYPFILWVSASTKAILDDSFANYADKLKADPSLKQAEKIAFVKTWLENNVDWLLIFDNADDANEITMKVLQALLPAAPSGKILFTTQIIMNNFTANLLPINCLDKQEGARFLCQLINADKKFTPGEISDAEAISVALTGLPLALAQAAAYIKATQCGLSKYLPLYKQNAKALLEQDQPLITDHIPVFATFQLSFSRLSAEAQELLAFCSMLHADSIPEEILTTAFELDAFALDQRLIPILCYGLMARNSDDEILSLHRLVQQVLQLNMDDVQKRLFTERAVLAVNELLPDVKFENWPLHERFLLSGLACIKWIDDYRIENVEAGRLLHKFALYLKNVKNDDRQAESLLRKSLTVRENALESDHLDTAKSLNSLAILLKNQGKLEEAESAYKKSLAIREKILGQDDIIVAKSLNNLASLYYRQGKYDQAEDLYKRSLVIREKNHSDVATALKSLGSLYETQGKYEQAESFYQRSLAIREETFGQDQDHPDTIGVLSDLGNLYRFLGNYNQAEPLLQQCLAFREKELEPNSPRIALSLVRLALLYKAQGKYEQAESLLLRNLLIRENSLEQGYRIIDAARAYRYLAELYNIQGKYEEAEPLFHKSLKITGNVLGQEHVDVTDCLNGLADIYRVRGKYEQAEISYQKSLAIIEKALGEHHYRVGESLHGLAELYRVQGEYERAESFFIRSLGVYEKALGTDHPTTQTVRNNLQQLQAR